MNNANDFNIALNKLEDYIEEETYILKEKIEQLEKHLNDQDQDINVQDTAILETGRGLHKNSRQIAKIWHTIKHLGDTYQKI